MLNKEFHIDDQVEVVLKLVQEFDPITQNMMNKVKEFDHHLFAKDYGAYFKTIPFFPLTKKEIIYATKAIDQWILDFYKNRKQELEAYEKHDAIPNDVQKNLPITLKPYWDILTQLNQNKWCTCQILERKIPNFEDLNIRCFSGRKATGPFTHDQQLYYIILTIKGKAKDIDKFINKYRIHKYVPKSKLSVV